MGLEVAGMVVMASTARGHRWQIAGAIAGLLGLFAYFATITFRRILGGRFSDFNVFYSAARAMLLHQDPYLPGRRSYIYPPLIAFLYMPLAHLSEQKAAAIVLCADVAFVLVAVLIIARECLSRLEADKSALAMLVISVLSIVLVFDKVKDELQMLQTNGLMLLMLALALRWLDRKPTWAGIALGFACNIKYLPLILLPWLLVRRRWRTAAFFVVSAAGFALLPALQSGWDDNLTHLSVAFGGLGHMIGVDTASAASADIWSMRAGVSLSITSAIARITHRRHADFLMLPMVAAVAGCTLVMIALAYRRNLLPFLRWPTAGRQSTQPYRALIAIEYPSLIALALVFSPQTNPRHLVLLLLVTALLWTMLRVVDAGAARVRLIVAAAVLLLGLTFPWGGTLTRFAHGVRPWFTYGGQGWCILLTVGLLIGSGLKYAASLARDDEIAEPQITMESQFAVERLEVA